MESRINYLCYFAVLALNFAGFFSHAAKFENIVIATHIEPPLVDLIDGKFVGQNVDVALALAHSLNMQVSFIQCPFARCLAITQEGNADMMVSIRKTPEREEYLHFLSRPFSSNNLPVRFYQLKTNRHVINAYEDISSLDIGVLRGATYFERFDHDLALHKIPLTNHNQLIEMLLKGRIDTFLGREVSIQALTDKTTYEQQMKMAPYIYIKRFDAYIAVSKRSPLAPRVNELSKALSELLDSGELDKLLIKQD
ncbi:hypothetical protein AX660_15390 [Paraglaciecola hydrolytica]|uniref:Solute-binding protein family 3/N-terminal domain-containing protein n=1 Tax=Paraglaciecola hydrolytica TaxID=1799789 RepID=A0A135ZZS3_9ALTE|nr:hypothetical protein AX660_15390 [Paraglaciecola hydrolytica]